MPTPETERHWYQFSLRSLLLFTAFVAILCSVGVCTKWGVSATIAASLLIGGVSGGMVAGTRMGFVIGAVYAMPLFFFAVISLAILRFPFSLWWNLDDWWIACRIAVLIGGVWGGVSGGLAARSNAT